MITSAGDSYGRSGAFAGQRVNLEFVSANPTGPLHLGGARWAAVGDALVRVLRAQGVGVAREYYFNDAGAQIDMFAESLLAARARVTAPPPDGYQSAATSPGSPPRRCQEPPGRVLVLPEAAAATRVFGTEGVALMLDEIKDVAGPVRGALRCIRSQKDLHEGGALAAALDRLRHSGHIYEAGGADVAPYHDFGDDKDRVLVRATASFTYFAADCAYYLDKRARGFNKIIIVLGADHHGYIGRMRAVAAVLRRRPRSDARDPHRTAGEPGPGWSSPSGLASAPGRSSRSATSSAQSAWTPPGTRWPGDHWTRRSISTWTHATRRSTANPVLLRAVRARQAARPGAKRGRRWASRWQPRRLRRRAALSDAGDLTCWACVGAFPGRWPARPNCARRTGWRAISRSSSAAYHRWSRHLSHPALSRRTGHQREHRPPLACRGHPDRAAQRPRPAQRVGTGADVRPVRRRRHCQS